MRYPRALDELPFRARGLWSALARRGADVLVPEGLTAGQTLAAACGASVLEAEGALGDLLAAGLATLDGARVRLGGAAPTASSRASTVDQGALRGDYQTWLSEGGTQARAAGALGVSREMLRLWSTGARTLAADKAATLAALFGANANRGDANTEANTLLANNDANKACQQGAVVGVGVGAPSSPPSQTLPSPSPSAEEKDDVVTGAPREEPGRGLRLLKEPTPLAPLQRLWEAACEGDSGGALARLCSPDGYTALAELLETSDAAAVAVMRDPCRWVLLGAFLDPRRGNARAAWSASDRRSSAWGTTGARRSRIDLAWLTRPGVNGSERQLLRLLTDSEDWYRREACAPRTPTLGDQERATAAQRIKADVDRIAGRYARPAQEVAHAG